MNNSDIFDRNIFKEEFKKIYNNDHYNFSIDNIFLSNIITNWKRNTLKFHKLNILLNKYDFNNNLILRD